MTRFSATIESEAVVAAERPRIWAVLTDPDLLARLNPLLSSIEADGDLWLWKMRKIAGLGVDITPFFTERMTFDEPGRIDYTHAPPAGTSERTGAEGRYTLTEVEGGTHLAITITVTVDLPLPRLANPAVTRVMKTTMSRTGDKFAENMLEHLGVAPT